MTVDKKVTEEEWVGEEKDRNTEEGMIENGRG